MAAGAEKLPEGWRCGCGGAGEDEEEEEEEGWGVSGKLSGLGGRGREAKAGG